MTTSPLTARLQPSPPPLPERPSRARYGVVALALCLAAVTYLDRVCISMLAPFISRDLSLSEAQMGVVFSAFMLSYVILEIPTAWWGDRIGTRSVLTRIVLWWSTMTIATAASINYAMLLATRFLFGAGEAGAWPCVASTFSRWIPSKERGTVQGVFFAGAHLSGGLTPMLVALLSRRVHWRMVFVIFGSVGFVWTLVWYLWYRDDPSQHRHVNAMELQAIDAGREVASSHSVTGMNWLRLLGQRNIVLLCLMYLGNSCSFFFCITWLPTFLEQQYHITREALGFYAGLPLTLSVVGDLIGGWTTDCLSKHYGLRVGRCALGAVLYAVAAAAMTVAVNTQVAVVAIGSLSLAVAAVMFTLGATWATCLDIGGRNSGVVGAIMNTFGNGGAFFCPMVAIYAKNHLGGWNAPLALLCGLFVLSSICWCFIDPRVQSDK